MDGFLERATPRERSLLGFPPVGHEYWDRSTIASIGRRYPRMDMSPYESAMVSAPASGPQPAEALASGLDDVTSELSSLPGTAQWRRRL
jgi:hypothetical protein